MQFYIDAGLIGQIDIPPSTYTPAFYCRTMYDRITVVYQPTIPDYVVARE